MIKTKTNMEDREDKAIVEAYERQLRQDHGMGSGDEEQDWEEQDWEEPEPCSICCDIVGKAIHYCCNRYDPEDYMNCGYG